MNKKFYKSLEAIRNTDNLHKYVIDDIKENCGDTLDDLIEYISGLITHGCISGWVSSLIFYSDTTKFYKTYKEEISELLYNFMESIGTQDPTQIFGDRWDKEDPLALDTYNQNLLAWYGYEEVARKVYDAYEEQKYQQISTSRHER